MSDSVRVLGGRYVVGELIGRGGMAEVHLGDDTRLGRTVAIKMLRADLARDHTFITRFRREAHAAAGLNHHAIVAVYDSGEELYTESGGASVDVPYIVMEYVDGRTLRELLNEEGKLAPDEAARITMGVLSALEYSHDKGIVHRDIKPANVMVTKGGSVKLGDFGIARALSDMGATMTSAQAVVGTARYLSPEQAQGKPVDERSDLYSAGCLFYELLAGRTPFVGEPVSLVYQHITDPPKAPSVYEPSVPASMDAVALHALEKQPQNRYQTAAAFRSDLQAARSGRPLSAGALATLAAHPEDDDALNREPHAVPAPSRTGDNTRELTDGHPARRTGLWMGAAILALLAILGIGWLVLHGNGKVKQVNVPNLTGQSQSSADATLRGIGLVPNDRNITSSDPSGNVVRTDPGTGQLVDVGSTVDVFVSTGPGNATVPDVSGKSESEARQLLRDAGFDHVTVSSTTVDNTKFPANQVATTTPGVGTAAAKTTTVVLNMSSGQVQVPDGLVGQDSAGAQNAIKDAYLTPHVTIVPTSDPSKFGRVISALPQPGEMVSVGSTVELTVGTAAAVTVTPPPPPSSSSTSSPPASPSSSSSSSSAPPSSTSESPSPSSTPKSPPPTTSPQTPPPAKG